VAIQGHHIGLQKVDKLSLRDLDPNKLKINHPLRLRLSEPDINMLLKRFKKDGLVISSALSQSIYDYKNALKNESTISAAAMLDIRMLYSALVDADFIETEAHFKTDSNGNKKYRKMGPPLESDRALSILNRYLENLNGNVKSSEAIMLLRKDLLETCLKAASSQPGLFTLTAPTGAGKTLSMMAFALKHAKKYKLRRIVFVIPYLSIIEQTVNVYKKIFSDFENDYILENHSLAGTRGNNQSENNDNKDSENKYQRQKNILAENWDAPIIITTSVQILESLFANRPSACRKLHRLAKSVILFDEVQTLPVDLIVPTLAALSRLTERYNSTVVFSTATQPAFAHLDDEVKAFCAGGWQPNEIAPAKLNLFNRVKRTKVEWPELDHNISWEELADRLSKNKQALCIVNIKRHAYRLYDELIVHNVEGLLHLSTSMCPSHRQDTLREVHARLESNSSCLLVSTQCVEAGVDIDFPVVYRAMGPLDAIAQAAGRCNRNGKLENGSVKVFLPEVGSNERVYPSGDYSQAADITKMLLRQYGADGLDIDNPKLFEEYYRKLYMFKNIENMSKDLTNAIKRQDFVETSKEYRVIKQNSINVLVPYNEDIYNQLKKDAETNGLSREWIAKARPYTIGLYRPRDKDPIWVHLDPVPIYRKKDNRDDWFIYLEKEDYDLKKGLNPSTKDYSII